MPGLKKALTRRRFNTTDAIDDRLIITGMCHNGEHAVLHIGLSADARALERYRRALRSGTAVRFSVAGDVVALDLMRGRRVVGRILTSLANAVLVELVDCAKVQVTPFLPADPSTREVSFDFRATRVDVSVEELYGDPEVHGHGDHIRYEINKVSGKWAFYRHRSRAQAEAAVVDHSVTMPNIPADFDAPVFPEFGIEAAPPPSWADRVIGPCPVN